MDIYGTKFYKSLDALNGKRVLRIAVIAIFLLLLIDVALLAETPGKNRISESFTIINAMDYVNSAASHMPKVLFTGDSVIHDGNIETEDTIPAYYEKSMKEFYNYSIETFSLTFPGASIAEQYLIMKNALGSADIMIFNINIIRMKESKKSVNNDLIYLRMTTKDDLKGLDAEKNYSEFNHFMANALNNWKLYKRRLLIISSFLKPEDKA
ncbi:MAG: hypothetical protein QMD85_05750, partial [Candidatus Aenigmarchaeota archaeon]|nr:hypothetical protein [Candidatus Aenigmarchaeota archaeon]